jgi:hypothetical protein
MATGPRSDAVYSPHDTKSRIDSAVRQVDCIIDGTLLSAHDVNWDEPFVREAIYRTLRQMKALQQRSDDLAVIERVFGKGR